MARATNVRDSPEDYESDSLLQDASDRENDDIQQDRSYHVDVMFTADEGKAFFEKCYNCGEPGHPWWECKKPLRPATLEDYHSTREPSKFEYESEGSEGPGTDSTGYSSTTTATSYHDTDNTQHSDTKNHDRKCQRQKHRDQWEHQSTNARKQRDRKNGWVVLPLFPESTKEGALTYTNWSLEVEEYITKKYPGPKIKEAMFTSLEGKAKRNYQACDEKGDLSPEKILKKMDMIYGTFISFWDLNAKLCGLKQGDQESPKLLRMDGGY